VGRDDTWATPLLFKPLAHGAFAAEALTKYVGGHSDLLLGSITVADVALRDRLKDVLRAFGVGVSPDEAALDLRGIETMGVRLKHGLRLFAIGASWGGTRSLIAPMAIKDDRSVTPWTHEGPVLRISVGLEDEVELWDDLASLLAAAEGIPQISG